jgi:2-iminobutanoate/2-iminopropanoate deaminase
MDAADSTGNYSPSVRIGSIVAVSGQCGYLPDRTLVDGLRGQIEQSITNLDAALAANGASRDDVLSAEVYLADEGDFAAMNEIYVQYFTPPRPVRTTVVAGLRPGVLFEISALAVVSP